VILDAKVLSDARPYVRSVVTVITAFDFAAAEKTHRDLVPPSRQRSSKGSILFLPDEIVEQICVANIEVGAKSQTLVRELHVLSTICQRIRNILLPHIYRHVVVDSKMHFPFCQLTPTYGHLCESLTLYIAGSIHLIFETLTPQCAYLSRLQVLRLHIQQGDKSSSTECFSPYELVTPDAMTPTQLIAWKGLCKALPDVSELHLHGFTWSDAATGFWRAGEKPSITKLCLDLTESERRPTPRIARIFNDTFSGLVNISLPNRFCPTPAWIYQAFASRMLQSIEIGDSVHSRNVGHHCRRTSCNWTSWMEALVELNAASLTSLTIQCNLSLRLSFEQSAFLSLTTLALDGMEVPNSETFKTFMGFFFDSPLQKLQIRRIHGPVPESFSSWFDPKSGRWPGLRTLLLQGIYTQCGPGDDYWDEDEPGDRLPEGDDCWSSQTRIMLEDYCIERRIIYDFDWEWFEGFG
jgi:hypothetical protein